MDEGFKILSDKLDDLKSQMNEIKVGLAIMGEKIDNHNGEINGIKLRLNEAESKIHNLYRMVEGSNHNIQHLSTFEKKTREDIENIKDDLDKIQKVTEKLDEYIKETKDTNKFLKQQFIVLIIGIIIAIAPLYFK
jgi:chromosome segregation ATPase